MRWAKEQVGTSENGGGEVLTWHQDQALLGKGIGWAKKRKSEMGHAQGGSWR
jgi:hypothetical protein